MKEKYNKGYDIRPKNTISIWKYAFKIHKHIRPCLTDGLKENLLVACGENDYFL